jgi:type VI secretion system secreted protein VgrG
VVGKEGEEIWVDQLGSVKVQFYWDREGKKNEQSSCWIRVSQLWAGKGWGSMWIPRVGQEVVVSFLEGDPDRPLITGRVYNADQVTPYDLPDHQTVSTIKSRSTKGGNAENFNEIKFEDKKGQEDLLIHAENAMHNSVEGNQFINVAGNRNIMVGTIDENGNVFGDVKELIFREHHLHVRHDQRVRIDQNVYTHVLGNVQHNCEGWVGYYVDKIFAVKTDGKSHWMRESILKLLLAEMASSSTSTEFKLSVCRPSSSIAPSLRICL